LITETLWAVIGVWLLFHLACDRIQSIVEIVVGVRHSMDFHDEIHLLDRLPRQVPHGSLKATARLRERKHPDTMNFLVQRTASRLQMASIGLDGGRQLVQSLFQLTECLSASLDNRGNAARQCDDLRGLLRQLAAAQQAVLPK